MGDLDDLLDDLIPGAATGGPSGMDDPPFPTSLNLEPRGVLGRGGSGVVYRAWDPTLEREVAVKVHRPSKGAQARKALLAEARRAASLQHPAVLPVHGVRAADSLLCVISAVGPERTLADAWADQRETGNGPSTARVLRWLAHVGGAVVLAHEVGVVHGDLHPGNIALGPGDTAFLLDWGLSQGGARTITGHLGYVAPELLHGAAPDRASDVFSLGALLFEAVSGRPLRPRREGETAARFVARWRNQDLPALPSEVDPGLASLVRNLLALQPAERPTLAEAVRTLDRIATGQSERHRRARRAQALMERARDRVEMFREVEERLGQERQALSVQRAKVVGYAPLFEKRPLWEAEDRVRRLQVERRSYWWDAIEAAAEAWFLDSTSEARRTMAELWWLRLREAEATGDGTLLQLARERVQALDDGHYARMLHSPGTLTVEVEPPGTAARVLVQRFVERERRLVPETLSTHPAPLRKLALEAGSYLITVQAEGAPPVPCPVVIRRLHHHSQRVRVYRQREIGEGWVVMPSGPFQLGGDPGARQPLDACAPFLPDRFVKRTLVTTAEYKAFLDALPVEQARAHLPGEQGLFGGFHTAWTHGASGWCPPASWSLEWPIFAINQTDMLAFAAWRSEVEGRAVRLPTEEEWEKAARGVDGRVFPWGDHFDPTWCHMRRSRPGSPMPAEVDAYPVDTSVYGCVDMAGLLREVTGSRFDEGQLVIRGGTWGDDADDCRCANRAGIQPIFRSSFVGFRLVAEDVVGSPLG